MDDHIMNTSELENSNFKYLKFYVRDRLPLLNHVINVIIKLILVRLKSSICVLTATQPQLSAIQLSHSEVAWCSLLCQLEQVMYCT